VGLQQVTTPPLLSPAFSFLKHSRQLQLAEVAQNSTDMDNKINPKKVLLENL